MQEDLFLFAKFSVACLKGGDFEYEAYAKRIISCTTGYRIAIDALNMFCSFVPDFSGWAEMYDHILKAFPW